MSMTSLASADIASAALNDEERAALGHRYRSLRTTDGQSLTDFADSAFGASMPCLPPPLLCKLVQLRSPNSPGTLLIRNLPIDPELPPTPNTDGRCDDGLPVSLASLLGPTRILGEPYSYRGEYDGGLVAHVAPTVTGAETVSSQGAKKHLGFHTEDVHLNLFSPDYVALLCLRKDPSDDARTLLVSAAEVCQDMSEEDLGLLRLPYYHVRAPRSFGSHTMGSGPIPVVSGPRRWPQLHLESSDMVALRPDAKAALDRLRDRAKECEIEVSLDAGDLLVIDNRKVVHGRTSFSPLLNGTDRWCLRTILRSGDLWNWRLYLSESNRLIF